jgi:hypothetical protein
MPILNTADTLYVGDQAVEIVYLDENIVWSAGAFIRLTGRTVAENAANGFTIGVLSIGGTFSGTPVYSLTDSAGGRFAISGSNLNKAGTLDYETSTSHNIIVHVTGISPAATDRSFVILVTDVDDTAPLITSSPTVSVAENLVLNHPLVANETVTWTKTGGADAAAFTLTGSTLTLPAKDYETQAHTWIVQVTATDTAGNATNQMITVTITDVVDTDITPPVISSSPTVSIAENLVLTHTLTADDAVTWTKTGGADAAAFTLTGNTLTLPAKDYETQAHTWVVQVTATNTASLATNQTITVTITDVDETAPVISSSAAVSIAENTILTHTLVADDVVTWTKTGGADAAAFTLTGNTLTLPAKDYETQAHTWTVQVTATNAASLATNQTIIVTITDVGEGGGTAGEMFGFFFPLTKAA